MKALFIFLVIFNSSISYCQKKERNSSQADTCGSIGYIYLKPNAKYISKYLSKDDLFKSRKRIQNHYYSLDTNLTKKSYVIDCYFSVDTSKFLFFDSLTDAKKAVRISYSFTNYLKILKLFNRNRKYKAARRLEKKLDKFRDEVYDPMKFEFRRLYHKTQDSLLLSLFFKITDEDGGSADATNSAVLADLFIINPKAFTRILKYEIPKVKDYIIWRLTKGGAFMSSTLLDRSKDINEQNINQQKLLFFLLE